MRPLTIYTPLFALALLTLAGCAGTPKAASCEGAYRSLNPTHYDLKETAGADVQPSLPKS
jgi:hypothetical protein